MTKAAKLGTGGWGLGARENPPEPSPQPSEPRTQPPASSRETLGCELAAEVLRSSGRLRLRATGASMLPAVWPNDILSVRRHDASETLPGDIILFARQGRLVAHRVVDVRSQEREIRSQERSPIANNPSPVLTFVTRGDSAEGNDPPVSSHELLGRVIAIERGFRRLTPHQSVVSRLISWILRRSDFATRVLLWVGKPTLGTRDPGLGAMDLESGICNPDF